MPVRHGAKAFPASQEVIKCVERGQRTGNGGGIKEGLPGGGEPWGNLEGAFQAVLA